jgi:hypothetical protein
MASSSTLTWEPAELIEAVDRRRALVCADVTGSAIERLPEHLPLAI